MGHFPFESKRGGGGTIDQISDPFGRERERSPLELSTLGMM